MVAEGIVTVTEAVPLLGIVPGVVVALRTVPVVGLSSR